MTSSSSIWTLGLSESHNGSACLLRDGKLFVAVQEERLTRAKRQRLRADRDALCIRYCLDHASIRATDLDAVAIALLDSRERTLRRLRHNPLLAEVADTVPMFGYTHHVSHAAYGAATAGVDNAAILVADGMGSPFDTLSAEERRAMPDTSAAICDGAVELWESVSIYDLTDGVLTPRFKQLTAPAIDRRAIAGEKAFISTLMNLGLGGMYERSSHVIFHASQQSGKVMGLAPFGTPSLPVDAFHSPREDGTLEHRNPLELGHQNVFPSKEMRAANDPTSGENANLAAAIQCALEDGMLHFARLAAERTGKTTLVLSGGVALNGVANERIIRETGYEKVHLPPAVEDCGNAVGAAFLAHWERHGWHKPAPLRVDAAGRPHQAAEIDAALAANPLVSAENLGDQMIDAVVDRLVGGEIVGWLQGRSELGPRALGQRSILCDPRPKDAKDHLNARVKRREAFRPFAPLILADEAPAWFDLTAPDGQPIDPDGPFMTRVVPIRPEKRDLIPAVTHVDGTGRFQTVSPANGAIHDLLVAFHERTGVPVLLNTSFNLADEPIVETPSDALFDLLITDIDAVALHDRIATRRDGRMPGILDLAPRVIAQGISSADAKAQKLDHHSVRSGSADMLIDKYFRVEYPLGPMPVQIGRPQMMVFVLADGIRTGRQIYEMMKKAQRDETLTERRVENIIAELARLRIVELSADGIGAIRLV